MHIEPGVVTGAKLILSYATAVGSFGLAASMLRDSARTGSSMGAVAPRSIIATALVFAFFEVLPHQALGVSEVHLILGSTLFLVFGAGPAALGLILGLLFQGLFFAPFDLPQYGMNITTLLVPLYAMSKLAGRIIPAGTAYKDVGYGQLLALSTSFQAGIVAWVSFWALYGEGVSAATLANIATFGLAYLSVIIIEPLVDLAVLAVVKSWRKEPFGALVQRRVYRAA